MAEYFNGTKPTKPKSGKTPSVTPDPQQKVGAPVPEVGRDDAEQRMNQPKARNRKT